MREADDVEFGEEVEPEVAPVRGRTRWLRFAGTFAVGGVLAGGLLVAVAQGAIAASFAVSGTSFEVTATQLRGTGFVQYPGIAANPDVLPHPVAVNGFATADLDNFCQSVFMPNNPFIGDLTLRITADGTAGMHAKNMVADVAQVDGDFTLTKPDIGVDASQVQGGPPGAQGRDNDFGMQSTNVTIDNLKQVAWGTSAETISFKGMSLRIVSGNNQCIK
ncbi:DUF6230 family protein [Kutzneria buriramensis]|uniref:Cholesterol esterase n=1 Tax=Kutzneria buriramensis TaxID=1045776 RepID=A0A3E0HAL2_9PSEU|nr:DUF6230 family protein [Kutzneria buriramensis]REH41079.1 hypothetical protein BCF44_112161 [Kutzneria buriramensis]